MEELKVKLKGKINVSSSKYDLTQAQILLESGRKLGEVAKELNISYDYLAKLNYKNGWSKKYKNDQKNQVKKGKKNLAFEIKKKTEEKIQIIADKQSDEIVDMIQTANIANKQINEYFVNNHAKTHVVKLKNDKSEELTEVQLNVADTKAYKDMYSCLSQSLKLEIDRQRLEIEKQKLEIERLKLERENTNLAENEEKEWISVEFVAGSDNSCYVTTNEDTNTSGN